MTALKFEQDGLLPNGEKTYRLIIGGVTVSEYLTLDQVIEAINRQDEAGLADQHMLVKDSGRIQTGVDAAKAALAGIRRHTWTKP